MKSDASLTNLTRECQWVIAWLGVGTSFALPRRSIQYGVCQQRYVPPFGNFVASRVAIIQRSVHELYMVPLTGTDMEAASKGGWWVYIVWDSHGSSRLCHAVPVIQGRPVQVRCLAPISRLSSGTCAAKMHGHMHCAALCMYVNTRRRASENRHALFCSESAFLF